MSHPRERHRVTSRAVGAELVLPPGARTVMDHRSRVPDRPDQPVRPNPDPPGEVSDLRRHAPWSRRGGGRTAGRADTRPVPAGVAVEHCEDVEGSTPCCGGVVNTVSDD